MALFQSVSHWFGEAYTTMEGVAPVVVQRQVRRSQTKSTIIKYSRESSCGSSMPEAYENITFIYSRVRPLARPQSPSPTSVTPVQSVKSVIDTCSKHVLSNCHVSGSSNALTHKFSASRCRVRSVSVEATRHIPREAVGRKRKKVTESQMRRTGMISPRGIDEGGPFVSEESECSSMGGGSECEEPQAVSKSKACRSPTSSEESTHQESPESSINISEESECSSMGGISECEEPQAVCKSKACRSPSSSEESTHRKSPESSINVSEEESECSSMGGNSECEEPQAVSKSKACRSPSSSESKHQETPESSINVDDIVDDSIVIPGVRRLPDSQYFSWCGGKAPPPSTRLPFPSLGLGGVVPNPPHPSPPPHAEGSNSSGGLVVGQLFSKLPPVQESDGGGGEEEEDGEEEEEEGEGFGGWVPTIHSDIVHVKQQVPGAPVARIRDALIDAMPRGEADRCDRSDTQLAVALLQTEQAFVMEARKSSLRVRRTAAAEGRDTSSSSSAVAAVAVAVTGGGGGSCTSSSLFTAIAPAAPSTTVV